MRILENIGGSPEFYPLADKLHDRMCELKPYAFRPSSRGEVVMITRSVFADYASETFSELARMLRHWANTQGDISHGHG